MLDGKRVGVVIPAYNEAHLVAETIAGIAGFVGRNIVVDDKSKDGTVEAVRAIADPRIRLIEHERNGGVGAAIVTGYHAAVEGGLGGTRATAAANQEGPA